MKILIVLVVIIALVALARWRDRSRRRPAGRRAASCPAPNARVRAYRADVARARTTGIPPSTRSYRNLTRSDCARLWPGSPESRDRSRRP